MKFIIGKKIEMTQLWQDDKVVGVTKVQAGPCVVTQVKNMEKDGYKAVQIGFGDKKAKNVAKPQLGHFKKVGQNFSVVREFRLNKKTHEEKADVNVGDVLSVSSFVAGDIVKIVGTSKGKGFQGPVKRHHFAGGRASHGNKDQLRMPGSIGNVGAGHVFKGTRMAGRMGGDRITVKNVEVIEVDEQNGFIYLKGAVAGARNGIVLIEGNGDLKVVRPEVKAEEVKVEETKAQEAVVSETAAPAAAVENK
jgi:large subunit ribosomal protein L3